MTETRVSIFRVGLPTSPFLFANGRQQLTVYITILVETRPNSTATWVSRPLTVTELNSLTLVSPTENSRIPPPNWTISAHRNRYDQGDVRMFIGGEVEDMDGTSTQQEQRPPEITPSLTEQIIIRFLSTSTLQSALFTAGIEIQGLGWITATGLVGHQPDSMFSFQPTPPSRILSAGLQRHVNTVFVDYSNKGYWRGLYEIFWTVNGRHIPILEENISGGMEAGLTQPQFNAYHRHFVRWREVFSGVLRTFENRISSMIIQELTTPRMNGQQFPRGAQDRVFFNSNGLIRTYLFYCSNVGTDIGPQLRRDVFVSLIDRAGNESRFIVFGQYEGHIRDA